MQTDILYLQNKRGQGLASEDQLSTLKIAKQELAEAEKELKIKTQAQGRQQRKREGDKLRIGELMVTNPDIAEILSKRPKPGRPRIEEKQPELLKAIVDIATYGAGADERRRSETIRTIQTLGELTSELHLRGFRVLKIMEYYTNTLISRLFI